MHYILYFSWNPAPELGIGYQLLHEFCSALHSYIREKKAKFTSTFRSLKAGSVNHPELLRLNTKELLSLSHPSQMITALDWIKNDLKSTAGCKLLSSFWEPRGLSYPLLYWVERCFASSGSLTSTTYERRGEKLNNTFIKATRSSVTWNKTNKNTKPFNKH